MVNVDSIGFSARDRRDGLAASLWVNPWFTGKADEDLTNKPMAAMYNIKERSNQRSWYQFQVCVCF